MKEKKFGQKDRKREDINEQIKMKEKNQHVNYFRKNNPDSYAPGQKNLEGII